MMYDWDEYDEIDLFSFDFPRRRPRKERKDPNWCQYNDCQEDKEKSRDYCVNHNWECLTNNCENRIRYEKFGSSFCSEHKYLCQTEYCKQRIDSSYSYCSEHEIKYYCQECRVRIGTGESYCSQHKDWKYCLAKNKICRINGKIFSIRDWSSHHGGFFGYPSYDEEENCSNKIFNSEMFCWKHQNQCLEQYCARRLDGRNKYCYDHAPACQVLNPSGYYCLLKITSGDTYCSSHNKVCQVCSTRISDSNTYCYDHERTCSDCSSRIAYNEYVCGSCENQKNEQNRLKSLVKQRTSIAGNVEEVARFSTWWSNNLATVINYDGNYWVFLLAYEPPHRNINEFLKVFPANHSYQGNYGIYSQKRKKHSYLSDAQSEANWLRAMLYEENPMLVIHPYANEYKSFDWIVKNPYVIEKFLPWNITNPDDYLEQFDIINIKRPKFYGGYYHYAIYLGEGLICNYQDDTGAIFDNWNNFLTDNDGGSSSFSSSSSSSSSNSSSSSQTGEVYRIHPIIPFKEKEKIKEHLAKAIYERMGKLKGNCHKYCLASNNCEHFSLSVVLGINYSKQAETHPDATQFFCSRFPGPINHDGCIANNGNSSVFLRREIRETNSKLSSLTSNNCSYEKERIGECIQAQIEVPTKDCKIM